MKNKICQNHTHTIGNSDISSIQYRSSNTKPKQKESRSQLHPSIIAQPLINKEKEKKTGDELKYYGRDILNNSGVNLVTGLITALISGYLTTKVI